MMRYMGGAYWPGVPARDLTDEEWAALTPEVKMAVAELYEAGAKAEAEVMAEAEAEVVSVEEEENP